ncbi:MerR family transcriptional regulator [Cohnella nanjingensis]|uniref:MerR family transcriptional regulator n=1 Tax=Cohnella nanjingensis TaxID=1387779 RepID=A0A7X0VHW9_9BACL|nr:MerR family transcriptional regulator [Cohnella nanjingensis]MBB6673074.1 MerR family transcriptional regulator [Cohnella nanjingensis]
MTLQTYTRGQLAKLANVNGETLRYYEKQGLLPPPARSESGYRLYADADLARLAFIKNAQSCGFTLREIKKALTRSERMGLGIDDFLLAIAQKRDRIRRQIAEKQETLARLDRLEAQLCQTDKSPQIRDTLRELHMDT